MGKIITPDELDFFIEEARRDFLLYVRLCNPKYIISDVHVYLAKLLQGVAEDLKAGKSRRILISTPPRVGKSTLVSIEFATWLMGRENWREIITAGYAQEFINKHSRSARNRIWYDPVYHKIFPKTKIVEGDSQVREWAVSGGGRYKAVGIDGQATGSGASCLTGDTKIVTILNNEVKIVPISKIKVGQKVLSYARKGKNQVWRRVTATSCRPADGYYRITTTSGRVVKATGEHPFYVNGKWAKADSITKGDSLLLAVQDGFCEESLRLQASDSLRFKGSVLFDEMSDKIRVSEKENPPMQDMRKSDQEEVGEVLLRGMQENGRSKKMGFGKKKKIKAVRKDKLSAVRNFVSKRGFSSGFLQPRVCGFDALIQNEGEAEPKLSTWVGRGSVQHPVHSQAVSCSKAGNSETGRLSMRGVRQTRPSETSSPDSSYRLKSIKQQLDKSGNAVSSLSRDASCLRAFTSREDSVALVERVCRKIKVWNLQIEGTENYFANGILTHNCLIVDDPIKNIEEALSENMLEKIWDAFLANLYTRLTPSNNAVIAIQTRWSKDDLIGRLSSKEFKQQLKESGVNDEWEYYNLPALAEDNDLLGRKPGDPLAVERFSIESWKEKKATQTDYIWAALYCGHPVAKGGNYICMDRVETVPWEEKMSTWTWMRYWDLAAVESKTADYTVGIKGALDPQTQTLYLTDGIRFKSAWPVSRERIKDTAIAEKIMVGVESVAGFKTASANLREVLPKNVALMECTVAADKLARALAWITMAQNWKVKFVTKPGENWIEDFTSELSAWPYSAHDDCLDAISGVEKMLHSHLVVFQPAGGSKFTTSMDERRNRSLAG